MVSHARMQAMLADEAARSIATPAFYRDLTGRVASMRAETRQGVARLRAAGVRVAGYGAAAKATTLLHHFGLGRDDIDFIVDRSPWKHGLAMPVTRIPILPPNALAERRPGAVVLLAWNFADEIVAENDAYLAAGGRFLVPGPAYREILPASEGAGR